ncbi:MAG TPA: hypothetical protein VGN83_14880 [Falsiroseomonas sp.]|jgi:hypothetical protein|nr:hypothetical protein [Falsiroseomonas sp.]
MMTDKAATPNAAPPNAALARELTIAEMRLVGGAGRLSCSNNLKQLALAAH